VCDSNWVDDVVGKHAVIVFPANELPFRILDDRVEERLRSHLAKLMVTPRRLFAVCEDYLEMVGSRELGPARICQATAGIDEASRRAGPSPFAGWLQP
jgi:hypothetical protein